MPALVNLVIFWFAVSLFVFSQGLSNCLFEGKIWDIKIVATVKQKRIITFGKVSWFLSLILGIIFLIPAIKSIFGFGFGNFLLTAIIYGIVLYLSYYIFFGLGSNVCAKTLYNGCDKNALILEAESSIFASVEENIANAEYVGFNGYGFYLYDKKSFCYYAAEFAQFGLGNLTEQHQIDLLRLYFCQKYGKAYLYQYLGDDEFPEVNPSFLKGKYRPYLFKKV